MKFYVCIQTHAYVIQVFLCSLQDLYFQPDIYRSLHNQIPKSLVLPLQHLLFVFRLVESHPPQY